MKPDKGSNVSWWKSQNAEIAKQKAEERAYGVDDSEGLEYAEALERRRREANPKDSSDASSCASELAKQEKRMASKRAKPQPRGDVTRKRLIALLNEDLAREYQGIISYVVYSQVIKGAEYMSIGAELAVHATEELEHALTIAKQIDYLGGMPNVTPKPVKTSNKAQDMLRFDLDNENETIRNYRLRVRQCEAMGEYAMAEQIREILIQEQDHQIALATALGIETPNVAGANAR